MASRTAAGGLGLKVDWALGEDNWKDEMDLNLVKLSVLCQAGVNSKVAAVPGSPAEGDIVVLDETNVGHPNAIAAYDEAGWKYFAPVEGWLIWNKATDEYLKFVGGVWTAAITPFTTEQVRDAIAAALVEGAGIDITIDDGGDTITIAATATAPNIPIIIAASDETTALTAGNGKVTFRMPPAAFTVTAVYASLTTAQTSGSIFTVDINEGGASILSTKLTIDNGETDSDTAATPAVISDATLAARAQITIDIDQIGDGTAKGLKVMLYGHY